MNLIINLGALFFGVFSFHMPSDSFLSFYFIILFITFIFITKVIASSPQNLKSLGLDHCFFLLRHRVEPELGLLSENCQSTQPGVESVIGLTKERATGRPRKYLKIVPTLPSGFPMAEIIGE